MTEGDIPEGWKLVPIEPTIAMSAAYKIALKEYIERSPGQYRSKRKRGGTRVPEYIKIQIRWRAMVKAAPTCQT